MGRGAALHVGLYCPVLPQSGEANGIVTYVRIMRDALMSLGHRVTVVTVDKVLHADGRVAELPPPSRRQVVGERLRARDGSHPYVRARVINAFAAARRAGVDVFEIEESFGWAGRLAGKGVAIVERLHGPHYLIRDRFGTHEQRRLGDLREAAERKSFDRVQAISSPTRRLLDSAIAHYGVKEPVARAIPNPIPVGPASERWRLEAANPNQILCVGRFDFVKGADIVLRAFARALKWRPSLSLVMAGPDPGLAQPDGKRIHFDEFAREELSPSVRTQVRFLGPVPPERIAQLRLESGFSLVGSRFENFPYSIAEAMAVGMPVLTTDTFGGSEMVRDAVEGRVVPASNVALMADVMVEMASDAARLSEMGRAAYARAADWLSPDLIARETVDLYCRAMMALQR